MSTSTPLAAIRKDYQRAALSETNVLADPFQQFQAWLDEAIKAEVQEVNAFTLSTVNDAGQPQGRIVLLKGIDRNLFQFFTNYQSSKGRELEQQPLCAATFFWAELERQVRITGTAQRLTEDENTQYFQSRPRASQIGAWTSPQSTLIASREVLEMRQQEIESRFAGLDVLPKPHQWGGFGIAPSQIEFWQGRPGRLHDRILYSLVDNQWIINRLAP